MSSLLLLPDGTIAGGLRGSHQRASDVVDLKRSPAESDFKVLVWNYRLDFHPRLRGVCVCVCVCVCEYVCVCMLVAQC